MKSMYYSLFLVLFVMADCKKDNLPANQSQVFSLPGTWKWVMSRGGIAGITETPASTGRHMQYTFRADSIVAITTDTSVTNTKYSLSTLVSVGSKIDLITIGSWMPQTFNHYGDTLVLADYSISDGFANIFVKE